MSSMRKNSTFSEEETKWIVVNGLVSPSETKRKFMKEFNIPKTRQHKLYPYQFSRVINHFMKTGAMQNKVYIQRVSS